MPEFDQAIAVGTLAPRRKGADRERRGVRVTKAAIEPVWYLPGIAERFGGERERAPACALRAVRRHVRRARHPRRSRALPASHRRHHGLPVRRSAGNHRSGAWGRLPRARRMQWIGRVRLRHLHLPPLPGPRRRSVHRGCAGRRLRSNRLQPQGGSRARRSHQVPGLQRAQTPAGRRPGRGPTSNAPRAWPVCRTYASRN